MRRIATPDEIFDILDNIKGKKFATVGYITSANIDMPKVKRKNHETNRMKSFDDYAELGRQLGYDDEIGGILQLTSYNIQLSNRQEMKDSYAKYKNDANDIRAKYGIPPIETKEKNYTDTVHYGVNGVSVYGGENDEKTGHVYHPVNLFGANSKKTYYVLDKEGHIDRECNESELVNLFKEKKNSISGVKALRDMGADDERIEQYIKDMASLKMSYKNLEYSSILYVVATVKGEKLIYINSNLKRAVGQVNVNPSEFIEVVKDRYKDDLADIANDSQNLFEDINGNDVPDMPFVTETEDLEKGITLMEEALKQYREGKYSLASHSRKAANKFFEKIEKEMETEEGADKYMYGESRNFGLIYHVIEENAKKMYESENGRKKLAKTLSFIKSNNTLLNEFKVYDALTRASNVVNPATYVNEILSVMDRNALKNTKGENSKLIKEIRSNGFNENVTLDENDIELYEAIQYVMENMPTISNLKKFTSAKSIISENVKNTAKNITENVDMDKLTDDRADKLTEKYNAEMNEEEKNLLKEISLSTEKAEKQFNEMKEELLSILSQKLNECEISDKEGWENIYETVNNKTFNKRNILSDIADMAALMETII